MTDKDKRDFTRDAIADCANFLEAITECVQEIRDGHAVDAIHVFGALDSAVAGLMQATKGVELALQLLDAKGVAP
jgi:hypothetical protein